MENDNTERRENDMENLFHFLICVLLYYLTRHRNIIFLDVFFWFLLFSLNQAHNGTTEAQLTMHISCRLHIKKAHSEYSSIEIYASTNTKSQRKYQSNSQPIKPPTSRVIKIQEQLEWERKPLSIYF